MCKSCYFSSVLLHSANWESCPQICVVTIPKIVETTTYRLAILGIPQYLYSSNFRGLEPCQFTSENWWPKKPTKKYILVGCGFNPFEIIWVKMGSSSSKKGWTSKIFELPPTRFSMIHLVVLLNPKNWYYFELVLLEFYKPKIEETWIQCWRPAHLFLTFFGAAKKQARKKIHQMSLIQLNVCSHFRWFRTPVNNIGDEVNLWHIHYQQFTG